MWIEGREKEKGLKRQSKGTIDYAQCNFVSLKKQALPLKRGSHQECPHLWSQTPKEILIPHFHPFCLYFFYCASWLIFFSLHFSFLDLFNKLILFLLKDKHRSTAGNTAATKRGKTSAMMELTFYCWWTVTKKMNTPTRKRAEN